MYLVGKPIMGGYRPIFSSTLSSIIVLLLAVAFRLVKWAFKFVFWLIPTVFRLLKRLRRFVNRKLWEREYKIEMAKFMGLR